MPRLHCFTKTDPGAALFGQNCDRSFTDEQARLFAVADASGPTYGGYHHPTGPEPGWQAMLRTWREHAGRKIDDRLRSALFAANEAMLDPGWEERVAAILGKGNSADQEISTGNAQLTALHCSMDPSTIGQIHPATLSPPKGPPFAGVPCRGSTGLSHAVTHPTASFTVAGLDEDRLALAQVGSCRGYRIRQGVVERLLPDHTLATQAILPGADPTLRALLQFHRSVCTRMLGLAPMVEVDLRVLPVSAGDDFLLCTDGVWLPLDDASIAEAFRETPTDPDAILAALLHLARETDPYDHRTCLLLRVS